MGAKVVLGSTSKKQAHFPNDSFLWLTALPRPHMVRAINQIPIPPTIAASFIRPMVATEDGEPAENSSVN